MLRALALPEGSQASGFLLSLAGLLGHAALQGDIEELAARRMLRQIEGLAQSPPVAAFAAQLVGQLETLGD